MTVRCAPSTQAVRSLAAFDVPGFPPPSPIRSSPALSTSGNTVYFGSNNGQFYARRADNGAMVVDRFASDGISILANSRAGRRRSTLVTTTASYMPSTARPEQNVWGPFQTGASIRSSPALSNDGSVVYIGSSNGILFAVNTSDGSERWRFTGASDAIESAITVDANGHIYFGSNDNKVYALYSDGTEKWNFTTGGDVVAKPAVKGDGTVYAGSKDGKLYAINQFTNPKNRKDLLITSAGQFGRWGTRSMTSETDWLKGSSLKGPWSVRLEITRTPSQISVPGVYNLRAWVRQCNQRTAATF